VKRIDELIAASSFGTDDEIEVRSRTPRAVADEIVERAMSPAPGYHASTPRWAKSWRGRIARRLAEALAELSKLVGQ
jgi:hypothetical protein